jgi:hypothetical protein
MHATPLVVLVVFVVVDEIHSKSERSEEGGEEERVVPEL